MTATAHLLLTYRYWILIPLCFIEGPIVAFIAGTLASLGYFNPYLLFAIFFVRDVSVDAACYFFGRFAGRTALAKRVLRKIGIDDMELEKIRHLWNRNAGKTMFFSKLSYGLAAGFIVVAGMVEMPFEKFLFWGSIIAVMHYGVLLVLGYYFGNSFGTVSKVLENAQYVIAGVILFVTAYYFFKRYIERRLRKEEERV